VEYLQAILAMDQTNGEVWGSIGMHHPSCIAMLVANHHAMNRSLLSHDGRPTASIHCLPKRTVQLAQPKGSYHDTKPSATKLTKRQEPKLWYGIGILYDRYGSLEHAEEAFSQVMQMQPDFEKANEIYFRLGIIYKQQQKYGPSLECFKYIVNSPPHPLTEEDIWFQIGHVHEQQKDVGCCRSPPRYVAPS
jgi:general transcriptional corepressor CYC8